jgi:hypothetical protein
VWQIGGHYQGGIALSNAPGGALRLLLGTDGFAIDATTYPPTVAVIDTGTPANNLSNVSLDESNLVQSGTSIKMVDFPSSPYVRWSPHNMFLNSGAPATQNVTLVAGLVYTVTVTGGGGGSITGTNAASGVATTGSPATFTSVGTTGTFTLAGSLDTIQLNRGIVGTPYLATTGAIRLGVPQGYDVASAKYGILVEPAATNLVAASEAFTNSYWDDAGLFTDNATTAPDSSTTAATHNGNGVNGLVTTSAITVVSGANYTQSLYAKYLSQRWIVLQYRESGAGAARVRAWFDLQNGVVGSSAVAGTGVYVSHSLTNIGNGWYRITVTGSIASTSATYGWFPATADAGLTVDSGDTHLWGAQLELGTVATSYIPTPTSGTVTRAADIISAVSTSFPYGSANTAYVSAKAREVATQHDVLEFDANDANEDESVKLYTNTTADILMQIEDGAATQLAPLDSAVNASANTTFQVTGAWATNDVDVSANGTAAASDGTATMPTITHVRLGSNPTPGNHLNGFIYKIVQVPRQIETENGDIENWRYVA